MDTGETLNVTSILSRLSSELSSRPAIVDMMQGRLRTASFADLDDEVNDAAAVLRQAGVRSSDVVLIYVPLQRELISLLLAVFRIGAQALFIDPNYGPGKIWHCLRLARPKFLIVDSRLSAITFAAPLLQMLGMPGLITFSSAGNESITSRLNIVRQVKKSGLLCQQTIPVASNHPALITFTSGSTGKPKGIVRSHGFLINQSDLLQKTLPSGQSEKDKCHPFNVMTTLPMFVLSALAAGQTAIIPAKNEAELLNQLTHLNIDRLLGAPHSLELICRLLEHNRIKLPSIKQIIVGGGPVFADLVAEIRVCMPQAQIITVYGSSEAEPICHRLLQPEARRGHIRLIEKDSGRGLPLGRPIEEITLAVIDVDKLGQRQRLTTDEFAALQLAGDQEGEIVVAGAHVIGGYLGGVGDCETKLDVGGRIFHRTGDAGYINNQGEVFLTGRISNAVISGEETIYPLTVELRAMENEGVERCAFLTVGRKNILALEIKSGSNKEDVLVQLQLLFAQSKTKIDRFVFVNTMPVDERHQTKIIYAKLKRQLRFVS